MDIYMCIGYICLHTVFGILYIFTCIIYTCISKLSKLLLYIDNGFYCSPAIDSHLLAVPLLLLIPVELLYQRVGGTALVDLFLQPLHLLLVVVLQLWPRILPVSHAFMSLYHTYR